MILTPRIAIAACSIVSFVAGGTVVSSYSHLLSQRQMLSRENCQVVVQTRGKVKLYDMENRLVGEYNKLPAMWAPESAFRVTADVHVKGKQKITVSGSGRQWVTDADGRVLGYAELVPYPNIFIPENAQPAPTFPVIPAESGTPEPTASPTPTPWNGSLPESMVTNGWNTAYGLLNDANGYYGWQFTGVGKVRMRLETGKVIAQATALPYNETLRTQLKHKLTDSEFHSRVGEGNLDNPGVPVFNITIAHKRYEMSGYTTEKFTLPSGMVLIVDVQRLATQ